MHTLDNTPVEVSEDNTEDRLAKWEECYVTVHTTKGPESVRALRHIELGKGLAVTGHHVGFFCVTHIASGTKVTRQEWERRVHAMHALLDLAPLADWTQDADSLKAEARRRADAKELIAVHNRPEPIPYAEALADARGDGIQRFVGEFPWEDDDTDPWVALEKRS